MREESHLDDMRAAIRGDFERLAARHGGQELMQEPAVERDPLEASSPEAESTPPVEASEELASELPSEPAEDHPAEPAEELPTEPAEEVPRRSLLARLLGL